MSRLLELLGALHPSTVHFPIALLTIGALLEGVHWMRRRDGLASTTRPLIVLAAGLAALAAIFGWILADLDGSEGDTVELHRWLGLASTAAAIVAAWAATRRPSSASVTICRAALVAGAILVTLTGYLGGEMVFGEGHLLKYLRPAVHGTTAPVGVTGDAPRPPTTGRPIDFVREVAPIIQTSCLKCHSAGRVKGKLRLDVKERAMQGGKDGVVIVPGDIAKSPMYTRLIDANDEDRMPQKADPLPAVHIDLIRDWIAQGADWPDGHVVK